MKLNNKQLKNITGGASIWAILGGLAAFIFGIGAVNGYGRPIRCKKK